MNNEKICNTRLYVRRPHMEAKNAPEKTGHLIVSTLASIPHFQL